MKTDPYMGLWVVSNSQSSSRHCFPPAVDTNLPLQAIPRLYQVKGKQESMDM